jgi:hypothetical protein
MKTILLILLFVSYSLLQGFGPKAVVSDTLWNIGDISKGETKSINLVISNQGHHPLKIQRVRGTCDCVVADYPKSTIMPSESASILLAFRGAGLRNGKIEQVVYIHTNDSSNPVIIIKIMANLIEKKQEIKNWGVKLVPPFKNGIDLGILPPSSKVRYMLSLKNPSPYPIVIDWINKLLLYDIGKDLFTVAPQASVELPLIIDTKDKYGRWTDSIIIVQTNLKADSLTIPVNAMLLAGSNYLDLTPQKLSLVAENEPFLQKVSVKNNSNQRIDIEIGDIDKGVFCDIEPSFSLEPSQEKSFNLYVISYNYTARAFMPIYFNIKSGKDLLERLGFPIFFAEIARAGS